MVFNIECSNHSEIKIYLFNILNGLGGYSSIGRAIVCGTICSLFKSGYPPFKYIFNIIYKLKSNPSSSMVRTLISCIKNENSNFSSGFTMYIHTIVVCVNIL